MIDLITFLVHFVSKTVSLVVASLLDSGGNTLLDSNSNPLTDSDG